MFSGCLNVARSSGRDFIGSAQTVNFKAINFRGCFSLSDITATRAIAVKIRDRCRCVWPHEIVKILHCEYIFTSVLIVTLIIEYENRVAKILLLFARSYCVIL